VDLPGHWTRGLEAPQKALWRVFNSRHTALNQPIRVGSPTIKWNRFDVTTGVTRYGASNRKGAFVESLAHAAPSSIPFADLLDDVTSGEDPVKAEWSALHHMSPGNIPAQ
jgi:hypothetical protein